jgi:PcaR/PcaU/PobR family beta-ketoadipate pathway transcriptional regulator
MIEKDYIKSLEKGLSIISLLSRHGSPLKLEELVKISGVRKTSCFRILQTLTRSGFAVKDKDTCGYFIGPKMISIGLAALGSRDVRELALPFMKEIRKKTGTTVNLGILNGHDVIFVERLQSAHIVETNLRVGSRLPVQLSSMGKTILAYLPEAELEAVLKQIRLEKKTEKTITSIAALKSELSKVREKGFALNDEELETGLFAIAVPLLNHAGVAVAAMNISFPLMRHSREEAMKVFCPMILDAGREISAMMGFHLDDTADRRKKPRPPLREKGPDPGNLSGRKEVKP